MRTARVWWRKPEVEAGRWQEAGRLKVCNGGSFSICDPVVVLPASIWGQVGHLVIVMQPLSHSKMMVFGGGALGGA